ncbi:hypothetical protein Ancab_019833 [Ancistrocladus abbreviatus]
MDHLTDTPVNPPIFSDIKDSDDEIPSKATKDEGMQSKSNGADFFDSEMFEWTQSQRACSLDLLLSPTKMQVTYIREVEGVQEVIIPLDLLKKYITYAKLNVFPRLHDADMDKLTHVYAELRRESSVR